jgi:outer membrane protein OmpA-like peptidoglycan-associated protein
MAFATGLTMAQPVTPSAAEMVDQLKIPRTRGLRNLAVVAADANTENPARSAPQARPSLTLQIQFEFNSSRINPESQAALSNLAVALQSSELLASAFAVEGHTDAKGNVDYNLKLSAQRAQAVRDFLISKGVNPSRLAAQGKGSAELANAADPLAAENRRVRIVNLQ